MFIKPDDLFNSIDSFKSDYNELYEMYEYLNNSRDGYISEVFDLRKENKNLLKQRNILVIYSVFCIILVIILVFVFMFFG